MCTSTPSIIMDSSSQLPVLRDKNLERKKIMARRFEIFFSAVISNLGSSRERSDLAAFFFGVSTIAAMAFRYITVVAVPSTMILCEWHWQGMTNCRFHSGPSSQWVNSAGNACQSRALSSRWSYSFNNIHDSFAITSRCPKAQNPSSKRVIQ